MSTLRVHLITPTADTTGSTTLEVTGAIKSQNRCATPRKIIRDDCDNSACDAAILVASKGPGHAEMQTKTRAGESLAK